MPEGVIAQPLAPAFSSSLFDPIEPWTEPVWRNSNPNAYREASFRLGDHEPGASGHRCVPFLFSPNFSHPAPRVQVRENPVPLYAAIIEDLGQEDFVKVDGAACSHTALLTPAFLARLGLEPRQRVPDMKDRVRCR